MEHKISVRDRSTASIRTIHDLIGHCLEIDMDTAPGQEIYGVRNHPGWRALIDSIEGELALRDENFELIEWDDPLFFPAR